MCDHYLSKNGLKEHSDLTITMLKTRKSITHMHEILLSAFKDKVSSSKNRTWVFSDNSKEIFKSLKE